MESKVERESEKRLRLAEVYLVPTSDGGLTLRTPRRSSILRGVLVSQVFPLMLPLLDGTRFRRDIMSELSTSVDEKALRRAIDRLIEYGMIDEVEEDISDKWDPDLRGRLTPQIRFLSQYGGDSSTVARIVDSTVAVIGDGPLIPSLARDLAASGVRVLRFVTRRLINGADVAQNGALRRSDIGTSYANAARRLIVEGALPTTVAEVVDVPTSMLEWRTVLGGVAVAVVATDLPVVSAPWLAELNKAALALGVPWTIGTLLQRAVAHVGPSVIPKQTSCWKCFEHRFKSNLDATDRYEEFETYVRDTAEYVDHGGLPGISEYVAGVVSVEALRLITADTVDVRTAGQLLTIDLWDYTMELHPVLKLPRCSHCSPTTLIPQERVWS
ncbi:MAG: hypothetical protein B5766_02860 [Candidatus Lumbricidophila eiseniae]|uniref:THIF-type NAD/FAD binding fold domain-containing protein n=1 Tax=Candidatus Lumbricidiphila eiseniae TaxID=1969409 RepID=A0A2A6FTA8_9MICO|nr:MAG: hypothetical protein B5766_02860 [Candidatus Lumbricidophila eiseniae]